MCDKNHTDAIMKENCKEISSMIGKFWPLTALILAIACMWGCYDDPCDDMEYSWAGETEKKIVGFVNDSFAIVAHANKWSYAAGCMCSGERFGLGRWTIGIYNYREQLDGPVFVDSVDEGFGYYTYILGQLSDSVVWGGNTAMNLTVWKNGTSFSFWKIGEQPHVINISSNFDGCSVSFPIASLREWRDGSIFAKGPLTAGDDTCQYAVLDTVAGMLTYKRLDDDLKWIQKCDDVRTWGNNVYCFMPGKQPFEATFLRNGKDTIDVPLKFTVGTFFGSVLKPNGHLCNLVDGVVVCSGVVWRGGLNFFKDDEIILDLNL